MTEKIKLYYTHLMCILLHIEGHYADESGD
jgi:hypothetical protein